MRQEFFSTIPALRMRFRPRLMIAALAFFLSADLSSLRAQTCTDWKAVIGWQGTYTLSSNGTVTHGSINKFTISETSGATVGMLTQTDGLCNQIRWQGADLKNTGSVGDSTQVMNACKQGEWFTTDTLVGNSGFPSNSELVVDATDGTFSFQPIPHDYVTHTIYNCQGNQMGQMSWATAPANNWPLNLKLPQQVGPLTATNLPFTAAGGYAGYQDINWTITFKLTPILAGYQALTVGVGGGGSVSSIDGFINCPGVCSHIYPPNAQVTLNEIPGQGSNFVGWNGACTGMGPCTVTMTQARMVNAVFSEPLQFVGVTPCRLVDTRNPDGQFGGPPMQGGTQRNFSVPQSPCNIPSSAQAYSLNITVVPQGPLHYLTVWPTGESQPLVSTMNSLYGRNKANAAIVPAGTDGGISFYVTNTTNLVVDVNGYFTTAGNGTSQFFPLPPCRVIDTRGPDNPLGGPYLQGGVERDFLVQQSECVPFFSVVGALMGHGNNDFDAEVTYRAGYPNRAVVVADFNGDGKSDLATANTESNISVLLGNGNGTFQAPAVYGAGDTPYAIASGDFNHDGKMDLVVANYNSSNVSVFLGKGDGTFQTEINYPTGITPRSVALGDFNGDSKLDLVVANDALGTVSILLSNGDGSFQAPVSYRTGANPYAVAVGDFNGDSKLDLATANFVGNNVSVLLGNGNGTFQAAVNITAHSNPSSVAVGDFNHDHKVDLAVANYSSNDVSVLLGNGNGSFQAAVNYSADKSPTAVMVSDLDGDGNPDLATANSDSSSSDVTLFLGVGNGTFLPGTNFLAGTSPHGLAAGDLNGDGFLDIAVAEAWTGRNLPSGYSFNVTVVPRDAGQTGGYLTVWPQGQNRPLASTLNLTGGAVANAAILPGGSIGAISVFSSRDTDLVLDINGYFSAPAGTGLSLYPVPPCRAIDTRNNQGQPFSGEKTVSVVSSPCSPPANAQSYVFNATVVPQESLGYLTLWPDGQVMPLVSTLNAKDGFVTSNLAIVPTSNGSIDAFATGLTHLILDMSSFFAP